MHGMVHTMRWGQVSPLAANRKQRSDRRRAGKGHKPRAKRAEEAVGAGKQTVLYRLRKHALRTEAGHRFPSCCKAYGRSGLMPARTQTRSGASTVADAGRTS